MSLYNSLIFHFFIFSLSGCFCAEDFFQASDFFQFLAIFPVLASKMTYFHLKHLPENLYSIFLNLILRRKSKNPRRNFINFFSREIPHLMNDNLRF